MIGKILLYLVVFGGASICAFLQAFNFSYLDLRNFLDVLLYTSGMVFTLMGLWVAFIYPSALVKITDPDTIMLADFTEAKKDTRRLEILVLSILRSALIVASILVFYLVKLLVFQTFIYTQYLPYFKAASIGLVLSLALLQLESIGAVVVSNVSFINDLHQKREQKEQNCDV